MGMMIVAHMMLAAFLFSPHRPLHADQFHLLNATPIHTQPVQPKLAYTGTDVADEREARNIRGCRITYSPPHRPAIRKETCSATLSMEIMHKCHGCRRHTHGMMVSLSGLVGLKLSVGFSLETPVPPCDWPCAWHTHRNGRHGSTWASPSIMTYTCTHACSFGSRGRRRQKCLTVDIHMTEHRHADIMLRSISAFPRF
ncbi:hypothetical protein GE09DRAFT_200342 [Coniochaeta sp. 2T2.1]|nr:hypothetical protein GE09DRAFT_200342 [Coniochaeta sp. 2T2.1]